MGGMEFDGVVLSGGGTLRAGVTNEQSVDELFFA